MSEYYDFDWGEEGYSKAARVHKLIAKNDETVVVGITSLMIASVVTARGRRLSPSSAIEGLLRLKRKSNPTIIEKLTDAWNIVAEQADETDARLTILLELINPRHRSKSGVSDTLSSQLNVTYESFLDFWVVLADMACGLRSVITRVFGDATAVEGVVGYLNQGMTRSQLLRAFGAELKAPDDDTEEDGGGDESA